MWGDAFFRQKMLWQLENDLAKPVWKFKKIRIAGRDDSPIARTQFQRRRPLPCMAGAVHMEDHDQVVTWRMRNRGLGAMCPHGRCAHVRDSNQADLSVTDAAVKIGAVWAIALERHEPLCNHLRPIGNALSLRQRSRRNFNNRRHSVCPVGSNRAAGWHMRP